MVELIEKYNGIINDFIWGIPMIVLLLGTGIYFSVRLGFFQIIKIKDIIEGERCSVNAMQEVLKQILEEAENLA